MKTLRKRLTALYTATTGGILFFVILSFLFSSIEKAQNARLEQFTLIWNTLSSRFLSANALSHSFLAQTEADYHMIIHIRENGQPFLYPGSWTPPDTREALLFQAETMAKKEGVFMDQAPISAAVSTSSLLTFQSESRERYYAMVLVIPTKHGRGVKSLCAIAWIPSLDQTLKDTLLYLCLLFILGIGCLWLVSWKFVGWSLIPVEESQKKQAQFIASASHELRSPLAVLRSGIAAIAASPQKKDTLLPVIDRECVRMSHLIDDMLLLASADAKSWKLQQEDVDMDTLLIDLLEMYQPVCREKGIDLQLALPDTSLPSVLGDAQRIRQIFTVLLDNACRFTPVGKSILLQAGIHKKQRCIDLKVIDEGCGIDPKDRPYLFDRFYQADSARSDKKHFGLGLSIAKELTELHQGKISVGNDEKGRNCFTVSLPYSFEKK